MWVGSGFGGWIRSVQLLWLWGQMDRVRVLVLLLPGGVTLDKTLHLSHHELIDRVRLAEPRYVRMK